MSGWDRKRVVRTEHGGTGKQPLTPLQEAYGAGDTEGSRFEGLLPKKEQEKQREHDR